MNAERRTRSRTASIAATFAIALGGVAWAGCGGGEDDSEDPIEALNEQALEEASSDPESLEDFDGGEAVEEIADELDAEVTELGDE